MDSIYREWGIDKVLADLSDELIAGLSERFEQIDRTAEHNQLKVIRAMKDNRVSEACLYPSTGYGYDDVGRETLEKVYASVFNTEDALVRPQIASGTHALAIALFGNLRPGDEMLSVSGRPYDTLEEVIGIRPQAGSLAEYGVTYSEVDLLEDGSFDLEGIRGSLKENTRIVAVQRSRGYRLRPTLSVSRIKDLISFIREIRPDVTVLVDNCYGEFVEETEPSDAGADLVVGSLIKNPGGGLAPTGGYIAGTREAVENAASRMTAPGIGREVGATLGVTPAFYQGLFLAPCVVASALKGAIFAAALYERAGFAVYPPSAGPRYDIIQAVTLGSPEGVSAFCRGIQAASPVDGHVVPVPSPMPGYDSDVIMAAGTFIQGASIELSADGPIRPPYNVYFQGGLTWPHAKLGILMSAQQMIDAGLMKI